MSEIDRGNALLYSGKSREAADVFRGIVEGAPGDALAHSGLGNALLALGDEAGAWTSLETACRLSDRIASAFSARAWLALTRGDMALARQSADRAITLDPSESNALFVLFHVQFRESRFEQAEHSFERAAAINPRYIDARHQLGDHAFKRGEFANAARHYRAYARHRPSNANAWMNLGASLARANDLADARECLQRAVALAPTQAQPLAMLAAVMKEQGVGLELVPVLQRLVELSADAIDTRLDLARVLISVSRYREAKSQLRRILEREPAHLVARWLMFQRPDDVVAADQNTRDSFLPHWREGIAYFEKLDWNDARTIAQADATLASSTAFYLGYLGAALVQEHKRNGAILRQLTLAACPDVREAAIRPIGRKRRSIVVFSPSLHRHSVERVWAGSLLALDPAEFELSVLYPGAPSDAAAARWRERGIRFESGLRSAQDWIATIQALTPDIVVFLDIGMHQLVQALASLRHAPVQVTTWAHPVTSGMSTIDYFLSADACEADDGATHYTERLVRLPRMGASLDAPEWDPPEWNPPATPAADAEAIRFLCSQNAAKLHPGHDELFADLLAQTPGSRLDILCSSPAHVADALAARMRPVFSARGIPFDTRCRVHPLLELPAYRGLVAQAAICLDSIDFSGCVTSLDALWCDRPIVTLAGTLMRGRQTSGLLRLIGLHELVAGSRSEYVRIAVRLAQDAAWRKAITERIRARKSALFDDHGAVTALADFLRSVEHPDFA